MPKVKKAQKNVHLKVKGSISPKGKSNGFRGNQNESLVSDQLGHLPDVEKTRKRIADETIPARVVFRGFITSQIDAPQKRI